MKTLLKKSLTKVVAAALLVGLYALAKEPALATEDMQKLVSEFGFTASPLFFPATAKPSSIRKVHPQYEKIAAWISSVGAAVAVTDLDGNGFCNDIIQVDPRFDQVLVSPASATPATYQPFSLTPCKLPYDSLTTAPMGTLAYDFNKDGLTDIMVYYWGRTPIIFLQSETGFEEMELNDKVERWFTNAALLNDFDGDGNIDILVTNYFPDGAEVLDANSKNNSQVMQHSMSRAYNGGDDHFFLAAGVSNNRPVYKENTEWRDGIEHPRDWTLAVGAADINGDMLPEIYFANDFGPDKLFYNLSTPGHLKFLQLKGSRRFTDIRSAVLGKDSFKGMGVSFGDINNDGLLDIYVSNIAAEYALEESHFLFINTGEFDKMKNGIAPFVNESENYGLSRSSWGWESKLADFNNDGQLEAIQATGFIKGNNDKWAELQELAIGNDELLSNTTVWPDFNAGTNLSGNGHNPFFVKSSNGRFYDIAPALGLDVSDITRGIAMSDVDKDGDLDFVTANQWEPSFFFRNNYTGGNNFIGLSLKLPTNKGNSGDVMVDPADTFLSARYAIGATVQVLLPNGKTMPGFVDGGNGHSGKNSNDLLFGLGRSVTKANVKITWRDGEGKIKTQALVLEKGWHTIVLPS
jgi:enediyne biosynthesis protein E4